MEDTDRHHFFWHKKTYSRGWLKRLRDHWYCSAEIPRDTAHRGIHRELGSVPAPRVVSVKTALEQLALLHKHGAISSSDGIERRLRVLIALFECADQDTADALKQQLDIVCKF